VNEVEDRKNKRLNLENTSEMSRVAGLPAARFLSAQDGRRGFISASFHPEASEEDCVVIYRDLFDGFG